MPKIYFKTIFATALVTAFTIFFFMGVIVIEKVLAYAIILSLITFIVINEKMTRSEKWHLKHYLLWIILTIIEYYIVSILLSMLPL